MALFPVAKTARLFKTVLILRFSIATLKFSHVHATNVDSNEFPTVKMTWDVRKVNFGLMITEKSAIFQSQNDQLRNGGIKHFISARRTPKFCMRISEHS